MPAVVNATAHKRLLIRNIVELLNLELAGDYPRAASCAHEVQAVALYRGVRTYVRFALTLVALGFFSLALLSTAFAAEGQTNPAASGEARDLPARVEVIRASTRVNALAGGLEGRYVPLESGVTRARCDAFVQHALALDRALGELEVAWRGWGEVSAGFVSSSVAQVLAQRLSVALVTAEVDRRCGAPIPDTVPGEGDAVRLCAGEEFALSPGLVVMRSRGGRLPNSGEETVRAMLALGRRVVSSATHVVMFRPGRSGESAGSSATSPMSPEATLSDVVSKRRAVARFSDSPNAGAFDWPGGGVLGLHDLRLVVQVDSTASLRDGHATFALLDMARDVRASAACGPQPGPLGWALSDVGGVLGGARPGTLQPVPGRAGRWQGAPVSGSRVGLSANPGGVTPFALAEKYLLGLSPVAATRPTRWLSGARRVDASTFDASGACLLSPAALAARLVPASPAATAWRLLGVLVVDESTPLDDSTIVAARAAWRAWTWPGVDADAERLNLFEASEHLWRPMLAEIVPRQGGCAPVATQSGSE